MFRQSRNEHARKAGELVVEPTPSISQSKKTAMFRQSRNERARKAGEPAVKPTSQKNKSKNKQRCSGKAGTSTPAEQANPAANPATTTAFVLPKTTHPPISL